MTAVEEFFLLFKSNTKDAQRDIKQLDAQIADLATKGKKRSDEETKQLNELRKQRQTATQDLQDQSKAVGDLDTSFSRLALGGLKVLGIAFGLKELKEGISRAVDFNATVEKTAKLTGISARELAVWNGVVATAGGNPGSTDYLNFITQLNAKYAELGVNDRVRKVNEELFQLSDYFRQLESASQGSSQSVAAFAGIGTDLWLAMKDGKEVLKEYIKQQEKISGVTDESAASAFRFKQQMANINTETTKLFTQTPLAEAFAAALDIVVKGFLGIGAAISAAFNNPFGRFVLEMIGKLGSIGGGFGQTDTTPVSPKAINNASDESRAFWRSLGYKDKDVAALLANESGESGFNAGAVGDNGQARGIFQWHPDRRSRILAATGIDVSNASHAEQLKAAAWELEHTGTASRLRNANSIEDKSAVLTAYEAPANAGYQAYARGQVANSYYAQMMQNGQGILNSADAAPSVTGGNKSITVGSITINSQATDANGLAKDLHEALSRQFASTSAAIDDGLSK